MVVMDLDALIRAQHGVCSTVQALAGGLTEDAVRWRVATGRWQRLGRGIYRAQTGDLDWWGRAHAALLRGGDGAALALTAAEFVHGVSTDPPPVLSVWVPAGREVSRLPGTRVRSRSGYRVVVRRGLAVTSPARTVLDLAEAPGVGWREAVATAARWVQRRRVTADELADALAATPRHRHRRSLELALGVVAEGAESLLEVGFVRHVVRAHGLPEPTLQLPADGPGERLRRDAEFERWAVVVELDGRLGHEGEALARDRRRDRRAAARGRVTLRAGWVEVDAEPCALAVDVHETLRARGWPGSARPCGPHCGVRRVLRAA